MYCAIELTYYLPSHDLSSHKMNIHYQVLISVLFLLVMSMDKSIVHSKNIISKMLHLHSRDSVEDNTSVSPIKGSREENEDDKFSLSNRILKFLKSKKSREENKSVNSDEKSGSISHNDESRSKNSFEESGSKSFNEESGSRSFNGGSGKIYSNEESLIKNSNKKNGCKNSYGKNGSGNSNKQNGSKKSIKKNESGIFFDNNGSENSHEENGNEDDNVFSLIFNNNNVHFDGESNFGNSREDVICENSMEENGKKSWPAKYLYTADTFHKAKEFEYPYHVAIVWKPDGRLLCQGALIKSRWIITSAACIIEYELHYRTLGVLMGKTSLQDTSAFSRDISEVYIYPVFNELQGLNDFALVKLDSDINITNNLKPVFIYRPYHPNKNKCQFSSYIGNTLYGKSVDFVFQENCDEPYIQGQILPYFCMSVNGSLIRSTKMSTLGSPLVCDGVVYGIKARNTMFSSVDYLIPWLNDVTNNTKTK